MGSPEIFYKVMLYTNELSSWIEST